MIICVYKMYFTQIKDAHICLSRFCLITNLKTVLRGEKGEVYSQFIYCLFYYLFKVLHCFPWKVERRIIKPYQSCLFYAYYIIKH